MMITLKKIKRLSLISPRSLRSHSSNSNDKEDESYDSPNYKILDPNLQKMDFFNRDSYQDRPYFLQPVKWKNYEESNYFNRSGRKIDLKRYPGDEQVLIDVEKFKLKEYLLNLLIPKKPIEDKDFFPYAILLFTIAAIHYYFFKALTYYLFLKKEMNEKKNMEKQTGYKKKDHQGKEIYESIPLSFDFGKFEKQLVEIEWELRDCLNKNV